MPPEIRCDPAAAPMAVDTGDHAFPNRTVGAKPVQQDKERVAVAALSEPEFHVQWFATLPCSDFSAASPTLCLSQNIIDPQGANGGWKPQRGNDQKHHIRSDRSYPSYATVDEDARTQYRSTGRCLEGY